MSNAKWRYAFQALGGSSDWLHACTWKFVDQDNPVAGRIPDPEQLGESFVGDCGAANGPFDFKLIEWVEFPARVPWQPYDNAPLRYSEQDLAEVRRRLETVGLLEIEETPDALRLIAYRR